MTAPLQETTLHARLADGSLAGSWILDPAQSTVALKSKSMWGLVPVKGTFTKVEGAGTVSPTGEVSGQITVATASLDTRNARRDKHLRSKDFFLAEEHPAITFVASKLTPAGDNLSVEGILTVRGRSNPLTLTSAATSVAGGGVALDATAEIDRSHYGLTWNQLGMSSMHNTITIHAVFARG
ncbi:MAG: YceI family protein [Actinomycetota bacterium]|nr:YceI family protein [Actinomycetota bacterium]